MDGNGFYWVDLAGLNFAPRDVIAMREDGKQAIARLAR